MKRFLIYTFIIGVLSCLAIFYFYKEINSPLLKKDVALTIKEGETPHSLFEKLHKEGGIKNDTFLKLLSKIKKFNETKVGYYHFTANTTTNEFINRLRAGKQSPIRLTFNNARLLSDLAGKVATQIQPDSLQLVQHFTNDSVANSYGFDQQTFIGMFIPNTYEVYYTTAPTDFTNRMKKEYERFWTENRRQKAQKLGYSINQINTLASIIDEETNKNDEKRRIAGVYINRLRIGMPLQADPTLKFAIGDFSIKRVLNIHKETDSPYNTYQNKGLPPGPIRQPSIVAIDAVLNYEQHHFLYFVARSDFSGYHTFSRNLSEHNRNARLYHQALNKRGIR